MSEVDVKMEKFFDSYINRVVGRIAHLHEALPISSTLILMLILLLIFLFVVWRKDIEYFTISREECPKEYLWKRDLITLIKLILIAMILISSFVINFVLKS